MFSCGMLFVEETAFRSRSNLGIIAFQIGQVVPYETRSKWNPNDSDYKSNKSTSIWLLFALPIILKLVKWSYTALTISDISKVNAGKRLSEWKT